MNALEPKFKVDLANYKQAHQNTESNLFVESKAKVGVNLPLSTTCPKTPARKTMKTSTSPMKGRKLPMEGKDEENCSVRAPLEILKDIFADKDLSENLTEDMQNILRAKAASLKEVSPLCNCAALGLLVDDNGPFYTQLGYGRTEEDLRRVFLKRLQTTNTALRIEKVRYTGKEGVTSEGCPIAKWVSKKNPN